MKKIFIIYSCVFILISRTWGLPMSFSGSQNKEQIEKEKINLILSLIKDKDMVSFRKLFIPQIEDLSPAYNDRISVLFNNFPIQTYEIIDIMGYEAAAFGGGDGYVQWNVSALISTNIGELRLRFIDIRKNYKNKKNIGIRSLFLADKHKAAKSDFKFENFQPGIFIRAEAYLTCRVVTKGIKADCNHLMRTATPTLCVGVVDSGVNSFFRLPRYPKRRLTKVHN